jgi:choline kinase
MSISKTIVISCAGTGARLGFGHTKALLKIAGKPIIIHHLEQLNKFDDIRIVVGFDARDLINTVLSYRKDVTFVFNHRYLKTHTLRSLYIGSRFARDYIISLDGDLLVAPSDLRSFLKEKEEVMGYCETVTDNPVYVKIKKRGGREYITDFNRRSGNFEWTGLIQVRSDKIINTGTFVYHIVANHLPILAKYVNCREIDTPKDYRSAVEWAKKIF